MIGVWLLLAVLGLAVGCLWAKMSELVSVVNGLQKADGEMGARLAECSEMDEYLIEKMDASRRQTRGAA
jgi:hypothetical protein